ncbi:unnamed protein product [Mytilus edulis]|uniref:CCHC-type domain-containing protein n=1 Tax=Mytilus edulis TaxID=6550 RepID=A0A8S3RYX6_MYTED|nr:unnamed protein product [Mytilus edulis]
MNAEVEALCRKMTQDRLKRLIEGLQGTDTFTLQNEVTVSPDVNNDKMATQVPLLSQNPHNPSTLKSDTIRIKVKNILLSADDGQIHRALSLQGCKIQGLFRERLRIDGKVTNCETGDRLVISKTLDKPIPRNLPIGKYIGRIFHSGQPEFENRNNNSEERICHKCLQPGHMLFQCPNDWACKICKESGHKMIDCQKNFQDKDENNQQLEQNYIESGDDNVQEESVELTRTPTKSPTSKTSENT